jgi:hypothetical protein
MDVGSRPRARRNCECPERSANSGSSVLPVCAMPCGRLLAYRVAENLSVAS